MTNDDELRIVMVGKTGTGKSATGNTILGRKCFESEPSFGSLTVKCAKKKSEVDGHRVAVIDTPGLFDTTVKEEETKENICQSISFASPGPHIFLMVIKLGRFTKEEKQTVQKIQEIFGEGVYKYSMVLFTYGDEFTGISMEKALEKVPDLQELVVKCNGQYHIFNNKLKERSQVTELLQKIREIVQNNRGSHYTSEMFQRAERVLKEETQRILRKKEEEIRKEKEKVEREIQERYEKEMQEYNEELEAERERERKKLEEEMKKFEEKYARQMEEVSKRREERKREEERMRERKRDEEMKEKWERILQEERCKIQSKYENQARDEAEEGNPVYRFLKELLNRVCSRFT